VQPPVSPPPPGTAVAWYKVTTGSTENDGTDYGVRFMPVYLGSMRTYSYAAYEQNCVEKGMRVWWDTQGSNTNVIFDTHNNINLGGHDAIQSSGLQAVLQGSTASGHGGGFVLTRTQMLQSLQDIQVPPGQHTIVMKYGHTAHADASYCTFTISSGYSGFSSVSSSNSATVAYDIAMCACKIGEDCPSNYV